jgi:hypothetical protein
MLIRKRSEFSSTIEVQLQNVHDSSDNKLLIENLRELADVLEKENPKILNFGIMFSNAHNVSMLLLKIDE